MSITEDEAEPDFETWLEAWFHQDFSWDGLAKKPNWTGSSTTNLQDYLRSYTRVRRSDDELVRDSVLFDCGRYGCFHLLFIPPEWADELDVLPFGIEELFER
jgi:hypothetical protein